MSETAPKSEQTPPESPESQELVQSTPVQFPEVAILRPCSSLFCRNGHTWAPKLALAKCGYGTPRGWNGCGEPMLALKMELCPTCNEPIVKFSLRLDITPPCPAPVPICIPGSHSTAEVLQIEIYPQYWKTTQDELDRKAETPAAPEAIDQANQETKEPING